jgi:2-hydroxycyclohexanecarboxyl-CoA dehydrogenase
VARTACVTGGAGGIGRASGEARAAAGRRVGVAAREAGAADEVAAAVGGSGTALDVCDPASVAAAVASVEKALGPVDVLVNCAGWDELMPFVETGETFSARVLEINLMGAIRTTRAVLPGMIERGFGRLVHVASDAGRVGSSREAVYSAAKGGLIAFSKTVAREVARQGITSNSVCPGPTDTPLLDSITEASPDADRVIASMTRAVPMRRLGQPADVAAAVAFLASEPAGYITGQTLSVSGGLTMV